MFLPLTIWLLCSQPCSCRVSYYPSDWQAVAETRHMPHKHHHARRGRLFFW